MKKSVSFNEKLNEIFEYKKQNPNYFEDYIKTINKYLYTGDIKKSDYEYIILKSGKRIKKNI